VDSETVHIGTFNLDPRSENLNTEAGVIIHDARVARSTCPDQHVSFMKRAWTRFWQLLPIRPLLEER
jgi:putative cardiolipin synthase